MALEFYVDGSCRTNPGPGGIGIVAVEDDTVINTFSAQEPMTTNNRMELQAILAVMFHFGQKAPKSPPTVYSDSAYAINVFTKWMLDWKKNGWLKKDGNPPENLDIIKAYYNFWEKGYRINLIKVKGHSNNKYNELADQLAKGKIVNKRGDIKLW